MSIQQFKLAGLTGGSVDFSAYAGKVLLVVNVASKCGLTPQYAQLEPLYQEYKERGFEVIGIPCNQFMGQEPGSGEEIQTFCQKEYDVSFALSEKIEVNGEGRHPLYEFLAGDASPFAGDIQWNFEKFLIDKNGHVAARFAPRTEPNASEVIEAIDALL